MAKLNLEIVTAEHPVYSGDVDMIIAPGIVGQLGILPNHDALMTILDPGELCVRQGAEETLIAITGGYLEVFQNKVVILADAAERAEEIDMARAEAAKQRAQERLLHPEEMDSTRAEAALRRSLARLKVAEHRRRRGKGIPT